MSDTTTWAWMGTGTWPNRANGQDQVAGGDGTVIPGSGIVTITWHDANGDGAISDADTDDGSKANQGDAVIINGVSKTVKEVGNYTNSTMTIHGQPTTVPVAVWLFTDGTYIVRIPDSHIPPHVHYSAVDSVRLGTYDNVEYTGSYVGSRHVAFLCFAAGTRIATPSGERPVEAIRPGDLVQTLDRGAQPVRWAGRRTVEGRGALAPVRIAAGALGNRRDLVLSPQHRLLLRGPRAELLFGLDEVLVAARHLVDGRRIAVEPCAAVTYLHLLLDRHEILLAEGCPAESLHLGDALLTALDPDQRQEVLAVFPELGKGLPPAARAGMARPCLRPWEARALLG